MLHVRKILPCSGQSIPPHKDLLSAKLYVRSLLQGPAYSLPAHKDFLSVRLHVRKSLPCTGQSFPPPQGLLNAKLYARPLLQGPAYSFPAHKDLLSAMPYVRTLQEHCCQVPVTGFPPQLRQNAPLFLDTVPRIPNCLILPNVSEGFNC